MINSIQHFIEKETYEIEKTMRKFKAVLSQKNPMPGHSARHGIFCGQRWNSFFFSSSFSNGATPKIRSTLSFAVWYSTIALEDEFMWAKPVSVDDNTA